MNEPPSVKIRSASGDFEIFPVSLCRGNCDRISCVASEPGFAPFCCRTCAESEGKSHSAECNAVWAMLESRIVRTETPASPASSAADPVNDQLLIRFLELGGTLPEASRARIHALTAPAETFSTVPAKPPTNLIACCKDPQCWTIRHVIEKIEAGTVSIIDRTRIHELTAPAIPPNYEVAEADRIAWTKMDLDARLSELVEWIKQGTPDAARARIHALTRKYSLTDGELLNVALSFAGVKTRAEKLLPALEYLRDRYEERGKYAPLPEGDTPTAKPRA